MICKIKLISSHVCIWSKKQTSNLLLAASLSNCPAYPGNILYKQGMLLLQNISFCREISAILQLFVFTFQPEEKKRRQKEKIEM